MILPSYKKVKFTTIYVSKIYRSSMKNAVITVKDFPISDKKQHLRVVIVSIYKLLFIHSNIRNVGPLLIKTIVKI